MKTRKCNIIKAIRMVMNGRELYELPAKERYATMVRIVGNLTKKCNICAHI
jgi:hypothetical protein